MKKDIDYFINERCENELNKNKEYLNLQNELSHAHEKSDIEAFSKITYEMQLIAITVSYKIAIKDIYAIIAD